MPLILNSGLRSSVDIVFCIDMTSDMTARESLVEFMKMGKENFRESLTKDGCGGPDNLRVRFVLFRDYGCDNDPMVESKFFNIDTEYGDAISFLEAQPYPSGGGDMAENSLEALALAMKSDWIKTEGIRRHVIILATDGPAKPLGECKDCPGYPADMPASYDELVALWNGMEPRAKRLLLFAPDVSPYTDMALSDDVYNVFHSQTRQGMGCNELDFDIVMSLVCNSI